MLSTRFVAPRLFCSNPIHTQLINSHVQPRGLSGQQCRSYVSRKRTAVSMKPAKVIDVNVELDSPTLNFYEGSQKTQAPIRGQGHMKYVHSMQRLFRNTEKDPRFAAGVTTCIENWIVKHNFHFKDAYAMMYGILTAMSKGLVIEDEMLARRICAVMKLPGFHFLYHDTKRQGDMLYLLGRMILIEGGLVWSEVGHYTLTVASCLGQLDAALLLDRMEKVERSMLVLPQVREIIDRAALENSPPDWQAIVAMVEYNVYDLKKKDWEKDLRRSFELLDIADKNETPLFADKGQRTQPADKDQILNPDKLEYFQPPSRLFWKLYMLVDAQIPVAEESRMKRLLLFHLRKDALQYQNGQAASRVLELKGAVAPDSEEWLRLVELAAFSGNPDASRTAARYYLKKDGWLPIVQNGSDQDHNQAQDPGESAATSKKNEAGLDWLKLYAAQIQDKPDAVAKAYVAMASVLRENGYNVKGKDALVEGQQAIIASTAAERDKLIHSLRLQEFIDEWDEPLPPFARIKILGE